MLIVVSSEVREPSGNVLIVMCPRARVVTVTPQASLRKSSTNVSSIAIRSNVGLPADVPGATRTAASNVAARNAKATRAVIVDPFEPYRQFGWLPTGQQVLPRRPRANNLRTAMRPARFERATSASAGQR